MKFLFDENVPFAVVESLRRIYLKRTHTFIHVNEAELDGVLDPELYAHISSMGVDALVTEDRRQTSDHLQDIVNSGVHWIGYKSKQHLKGQAAFAYKTATIVAAMDHVVSVLGESSGQQFIEVQGVGLDRNQRIRVRTEQLLRRAQAA